MVKLEFDEECLNLILRSIELKKSSLLKSAQREAEYEFATKNVAKTFNNFLSKYDKIANIINSALGAKNE